MPAGVFLSLTQARMHRWSTRQNRLAAVSGKQPPDAHTRTIRLFSLVRVVATPAVLDHFASNRVVALA
jgi:hypothetical protein